MYCHFDKYNVLLEFHCSIVNLMLRAITNSRENTGVMLFRSHSPRRVRLLRLFEAKSDQSPPEDYRERGHERPRCSLQERLQDDLAYKGSGSSASRSHCRHDYGEVRGRGSLRVPDI